MYEYVFICFFIPTHLSVFSKHILKNMGYHGNDGYTISIDFITYSQYNYIGMNWLMCHVYNVLENITCTNMITWFSHV